MKKISYEKPYLFDVASSTHMYCASGSLATGNASLTSLTCVAVGQGASSAYQCNNGNADVHKIRICTSGLSTTQGLSTYCNGGGGPEATVGGYCDSGSAT